MCSQGVQRPLLLQYAMVQVGHQWVPVQTGVYVNVNKGIIHHAATLVNWGRSRLRGGNAALVRQSDRVNGLMSELVKNSVKWQKDGNYSVRLDEVILQARV